MNLPDRTVLDNGAVLVSQALPSNPFVAFRGSLPAGMAAEGDRFGVAEFMAHLLLSGTRRLDADALAARLEGMGATLEFRCSEEVLVFSGRCTRATLAGTVRLLVDCLSAPSFPPREVERVRAELLNELRIQEDDTRYRAAQQLGQTVFPKDHPYGRESRGDEGRIRRMRRSDIVEFHRDHVGSEGLILAITGDVDPSLVEKAVVGPFSRLRGANAPVAPIPPLPAYVPRTRRIPMPHKSQADIAVGGPAVPRRHDDYYGLYLANLLFGRIGLFGRLGVHLRDDLGLAYYAYSSLDARMAGGMWAISAGVNPSNLERAIEGIRQELDRLRDDPFSADEIRDGKDNQVGSLIVSLEQNAEMAGELRRMEYYGLGMDFLDRYADIVRELPEDAVRAAARKYFNPADASLVVAGPVGKTRVSL